MRPLAVHHVSVNVDDVEAALAFYTDLLGLSPRPTAPTSPSAEPGSTRVANRST